MTTLLASPTLIGLILQSAGVLMIAVLCLTLLRTIRRPPLVPWTASWITLFISLMTLLLAFQLPAYGVVLYPVYMLFEYAFGCLVLAGCREYATGRPVDRSDWPVALVMVVPALVIPPVVGWHFSVLFTAHSFVYGCLFLVAWAQLLSARPSRRSEPGVRVVRVALLLLAAAYIAYAPIFGLSEMGLIAPEPPLLEYASFFDSLLLTMLGFGMVMVATGEVQTDLEVARDRLAGVAQTDHLTSAFNRYAFHALLDRELEGVAVIADIDNLKSINDRYGHSAGDTAIRAVASAIRGCIRADDLLFRWGGDEFLVLLLGFTELEARSRLAVVNEQLRDVELPDGAGTVSVSVSMGFAPFDSAQSLEEVIRVADTAMYGTKRGALNGL
ncbi:MAG: GGDEF domain-containing protein [Acidobacteriota bacterium]